ncbi:S-adenosyl-L-methionine-dependent methyltransferase [Amylocystis lapponica]|nr:S-adenosyl-L-methionine-dependent methyltransferase [Amylocystis lapponica]
MSSTDLPPSKLGTKEHWDDVYSSELANFEEIGDEGEIWFGEDSIEKMVEWVLVNIPLSTVPSPFVLEVGAGNGNLLFALCEAGYAAERMCGVDYSADAVRLAQAIAHARRSEGDEDEAGGKNPRSITFSACDFLKEEVPALEGELWDLVLDKGTFDAIALAEKGADGSAPADSYPARVASAVKPGGYFLITSCNFTEEELTSKFTRAGPRLVYHSRIHGNVYSSVAFQKQT